MPGISFGDGATKRTITTIYYGDGGTNRKLKAVWYGDGATKRKVWPATLSATVANVVGSTTTGISNDQIGTASIVVSGGVSPFTYSTVFKSGSSFTITNSTSSTPQFIRAGNPSAGSVSGTYTATVTDYAGTSASKDFTVTDNRA